MAKKRRKSRTATRSARAGTTTIIKRKKRHTSKTAFRKSDVGKRLSKVEAPRGYKKPITALGRLLALTNSQVDFHSTMLKEAVQRQNQINALAEGTIADFDRCNKNARH